MFMPPKERTILPPEGGWKEHGYYIVEASFKPTNPIYRYIFYVGFLNNGNPSSYNEIFETENFSSIEDLHYIKALDYLGYKDISGAVKANDH